MKKVFSILFIIIVLLYGTTIRYSVHYCQGVLIDSRLSVSGKNATCGMTQERSDNKDKQFSSLMCVNEVSSYTLNDNYVYSPQILDAGNLLDIHFPVLIIPAINLLTTASPEYTIIPPGSPGPLKSESEVLCVFRI